MHLFGIFLTLSFVHGNILVQTLNFDEHFSVDLHAHKSMQSQKEQIFPAYLTMHILQYCRDK